MLVMYLAWKYFKRTKFVSLDDMDLVTDVYVADAEESEKKGWQSKARRIVGWLF
ncbi:hypothetical protein E4U11_008507 [Claviceps purpurea]|nr:hypothetical protein E4U11_008507 [Claviceps purpurea]KAG6259148.1 hypothetical protein E4U49_005996 [Claviceps purpurea]